MRKIKSSWVESLQKGERIEDCFVVSQFNVAKKRSGENYLRFTIADKTGQLEARVWDEGLASRMETQVSEGEIVQIKGVVAEYGGLQVHVEGFSIVKQDEISHEDFRPFTTKNLEDMWKAMIGHMEIIKTPPLRTLLEKVFFENKEAVCLCVAGKKIHHSYGGGLLEHTLEVVDLCRTAFNHQPQKINQDILVAGALLHDIGKIFEYDCSKITYDMTEVAKMLGGHIVLGRDFIKSYYDAGFPQDLSIMLEHIILSHHGIREWGAVEEPKTIEAITIHYADLMSARINQAALAVENTPTGKWTPYDKYLGTSLYYHGTEKDENIERK
ncbi:MAG: HD domain-containing protein [Bacillota bacterium]